MALSQQHKFFVSYARKDEEFALKLSRDLRAAGANLWVDQLDIRYGDRWDRAIQEALKSCDGMLVILSPDAVDSDNVMDEVNYALEKQKRVVPVIFRVCDIPFRLGRLHHVDYAATDEEMVLTQVLAALGVPHHTTSTPVPLAPTDTDPNSMLNREDLPSEDSPVDDVAGGIRGKAGTEMVTQSPPEHLPVSERQRGKQTAPAQPPSESCADEAREVQAVWAAEDDGHNEEVQGAPEAPKAEEQLAAVQERSTRHEIEEIGLRLGAKPQKWPFDSARSLLQPVSLLLGGAALLGVLVASQLKERTHQTEQAVRASPAAEEQARGGKQAGQQQAAAESESQARLATATPDHINTKKMHLPSAAEAKKVAQEQGMSEDLLRDFPK